MTDSPADARHFLFPRDAEPVRARDFRDESGDEVLPAADAVHDARADRAAHELERSLVSRLDLLVAGLSREEPQARISEREPLCDLQRRDDANALGDLLWVVGEPGGLQVDAFGRAARRMRPAGRRPSARSHRGNSRVRCVPATLRRRTRSLWLWVAASATALYCRTRAVRQPGPTWLMVRLNHAGGTWGNVGFWPSLVERTS